MALAFIKQASGRHVENEISARYLQRPYYLQTSGDIKYILSRYQACIIPFYVECNPH